MTTMKSNMFLSSLMAAAVSLAGVAATAGTVTYSTAQSQFLTGTNNQGWYANGFAASDANDNYATGKFGTSELRSFYSFDLSGLSGDVTGATLRIRRGYQPASATAQLNLWDVTTEASVLNKNNIIDTTIFNDLGTGFSYGAFALGSGAESEVLLYELNAAALADIMTAGGFFSIGASLATLTPEYAFGSSQGRAVFLDITTSDAVVPTSNVPEPTSIALLSLGLLGVTAARRRKA
jgi:hypothetical protein